MKWTTQNSNLRTGDIVLVFFNSWLSRQIRKWLNIYRKKLGIPVRTLYSHAAGIVEMWGELYVVEAIETGVNITKFEERYEKHLNKLKILTPKKSYSKSEDVTYSKAAMEMTFTPTRYDFMNFVYQINMINRTKNTMNENWAGPTGEKATDRLYCSETVATLANVVRPHTFEKPWATNPLDVDLNKYYKEKTVKHD